MIDQFTLDLPCIGKTKFFTKVETPFGNLTKSDFEIDSNK